MNRSATTENECPTTAPQEEENKTIWIEVWFPDLELGKGTVVLMVCSRYSGVVVFSVSYSFFGREFASYLPGSHWHFGYDAQLIANVQMTLSKLLVDVLLTEQSFSAPLDNEGTP